jgi:hypothetical protein
VVTFGQVFNEGGQTPLEGINAFSIKLGEKIE